MPAEIKKILQKIKQGANYNKRINELLEKEFITNENIDKIVYTAQPTFHIIEK